MAEDQDLVEVRMRVTEEDWRRMKNLQHLLGVSTPASAVTSALWLTEEMAKNRGEVYIREKGGRGRRITVRRNRRQRREAVV